MRREHRHWDKYGKETLLLDEYMCEEDLEILLKNFENRYKEPYSFRMAQLRLSGYIDNYNICQLIGKFFVNGGFSGLTINEFVERAMKNEE